MAVVEAFDPSVAIKPPSIALALVEGQRALAELATLPVASPLLRLAPSGDGHPVMVLPGFLAGGGTTVPLRRFLGLKGYEPFCWELGRNLGPKAIGPQGELLAHRLQAVHRKMGRKVSLIGWSLGGVMAREIAKRYPELVRQVITLGSPFGGNPRASYAFNIYRAVTGHEVDPDTMAEEFAALREPPPGIPTTAIYSKTDGVVAWRNCVERPSEKTDNIEVYASHCGLGVNPAVYFAIADRLALPETDWRPFDRSITWRSWIYPSAGH
jgi:pimeloyl-ACP methyl ester carboxylesterase